MGRGPPPPPGDRARRDPSVGLCSGRCPPARPPLPGDSRRPPGSPPPPREAGRGSGPLGGEAGEAFLAALGQIPLGRYQPPVLPLPRETPPAARVLRHLCGEVGDAAGRSNDGPPGLRRPHPLSDTWEVGRK